MHDGGKMALCSAGKDDLFIMTRGQQIELFGNTQHPFRCALLVYLCRDVLHRRQAVLSLSRCLLDHMWTTY